MTLPEIVTDVVGKLGYGAALSPLSKPLNDYVVRRANIALAILANALRGKGWRLDEDQTAGIYLTYQRGVEEGAAEPNMRLMADAIASLAQEATFSTATARRHLNHLAGLSREEVVICAAFYRELASRGASVPDRNDYATFEAVRTALVGLPMFPTFDHFWGAVAGLCRTGWIAPVSGWDGGFYAASPQLTEVGKLVDFAIEAGRI